LPNPAPVAAFGHSRRSPESFQFCKQLPNPLPRLFKHLKFLRGGFVQSTVLKELGLLIQESGQFKADFGVPIHCHCSASASASTQPVHTNASQGQVPYDVRAHNNDEFSVEIE
jgi:hypothetical protein